MADHLETAPVLSTPDTHILNETTPTVLVNPSKGLLDEQFDVKYEISRTLQEIQSHRWTRIALQFPDVMLPDSARVFQMLARGMKPRPTLKSQSLPTQSSDSQGFPDANEQPPSLGANSLERDIKLTILADTSYGPCCVDEIAAEHIEADVVVHYGRACLSPTARLPVIHVFTKQELDHEQVVESFRETFEDLQEKVIVTADVTYCSHVEDVCTNLLQVGYKNVFAASIIHDPSSLIPNRSVPDLVKEHPSAIGAWQMFYISEPPTSLLLTLSSRVRNVYIYPTTPVQSISITKSLPATTSLILRRRYALVTSLATVGIWGILINTLSVKNYLHIVEHVKFQIAAAGKKSYLFVVGKLNAAKVANFSEIGGWVVIGCWESSFVDSKDFYKPVITPFELDLVLTPDKDRVWTGAWRGDFQGILDTVEEPTAKQSEVPKRLEIGTESDESQEIGEYDTDEESAPPEYDLRTGRYISHSRPMQQQQNKPNKNGTAEVPASTALTRRAKGDIVAVNGVVSPAADFLQSHRTWQGLGSDFEVKYDEEERGSAVEEGRSGVAKGYTVGESAKS